MIANKPSLRAAIALVIVLAAASCGGSEYRVPQTPAADLETPSPSGDEIPAGPEIPNDSSSGERTNAAVPEEDLLAIARAWLSTQELPDEGIPPGFLVTDRLVGECVSSFGVEVLEPEAAYRSGDYYYRTGDQPERVSAIGAACRGALRELGILLDPGKETFTIIYESYLEVRDCLLENGFPTGDPPTLETFVDQPHVWTPWQEMIGDASPMLLTSRPSSGMMATYYDSLLVCPRP